MAPPRSDAQRNREHILATAYDVLAADPDASLNSIAKTAGVGHGTLYRHFPTREQLILVLYRQEVQALVEEVPAVLAEHEPLDAFRVWFRRLAEYVKVKHGLGEALHTAAAQEVINDTYAPVTAAVAQILTAAEDSGEVLPGLDPADVLLLMGFLWRVPAGEAGLAQADRLIELVLDGLRER